jgi:pimeloyl-ACP methyl ester carboxylesterase
MAAAPQRFEEIYFVQRNGLKLYARRYHARHATPGTAAFAVRPLLCLPGLTRNSRDFHEIALGLSSGDRARDVYTLDSRGRGHSDYDSDWRNHEIECVLHFAVTGAITRYPAKCRTHSIS